MRRADKEIKDQAAIEDILKRAVICNLGLCDGGIPYVVPVNYGYGGGCLYIHSAGEGRKIDILRKNKLVSFAIYVDERIVASEKACSHSMKYRSVMGVGRASLLENRADKEQALSIIMGHYSKAQFTFEPERVSKVVIIKIEIETISGKKSG